MGPLLCLLAMLGCGSTTAAVVAPQPAPAKPVADPFPLTQVAVNGMQLGVRFAGPAGGVPVILLHGFPQTSYGWVPVMRALGDAGFRAIAPDQRGYSPGARPSAVDAYALPLLVKDILGLADALGIQRFHVVGHDWGAGVAWGLALFAAERVISLTSVSIPHPGAMSHELADPESCQHGASAYFDKFLTPGSEDLFLRNDGWLLRAAYSEFSDDTRATYLQALGNPAALGAAMNWYRANLAGRQVRAVDVKVTVPTLLVWSDKDPFICRRTAELTAAYVAGPYRYQVLHGVGHFVPELAPAKLAELILQQVSRGPSLPAP